MLRCLSGFVMPLMMNQSEAGAAIAEGRAKNRDAFLERGEHDRVFRLAALLQIAAHLADKLAR